MKLKPSTYQYLHAKNNKKSIGLIAQEVQELFPVLVNSDDEYLSISYSELSVIAIKAIQEQQEIINSLDSQLQQSESTNQALEKRISQLEQLMNQIITNK